MKILSRYRSWFDEAHFACKHFAKSDYGLLYATVWKQQIGTRSKNSKSLVQLLQGADQSAGLHQGLGFKKAVKFAADTKGG